MLIYIKIRLAAVIEVIGLQTVWQVFDSKQEQKSLN
jgi:hypothetical protein